MHVKLGLFQCDEVRPEFLSMDGDFCDKVAATLGERRDDERDQSDVHRVQSPPDAGAGEHLQMRAAERQTIEAASGVGTRLRFRPEMSTE